jgi:hypothetical protein
MLDTCFTARVVPLYHGAFLLLAVQPMPVDYGFRSGAGRLYEEHYGEVPDNVWELVRSPLASIAEALSEDSLS